MWVENKRRSQCRRDESQAVQLSMFWSSSTLVGHNKDAAASMGMGSLPSA